AARRIAEETRREIEEELVDKPCGEQRAIQFGAGLDVSLVHLALGEQAQHAIEIDSPVGPAQHHALHVGRPRAFRRLGGYDQYVTVLQDPRIGGQLAMAVDDDLERLTRRLDLPHGQLRIVLPHRADARYDGAGARTPAVPARNGCRAPASRTASRRGPIHRALARRPERALRHVPRRRARASPRQSHDRRARSRSPRVDSGLSCRVLAPRARARAACARDRERRMGSWRWKGIAWPNEFGPTPDGSGPTRAISAAAWPVRLP